MKSVVKQMDLDDEWEVLPVPEDGFVEMNNNDKISSVLEMNYFICPPELVRSKTPDDDPMESQISQEILLKKTEFVDMKIDSPESGAPEMEFHDSAEVENVWKRGIGAICSFGVAAFCIIVLGHQNRHPNQKQQLRFQIYSSTQKQKASRLNEAIKGGVPISRARITCGGYYDAPPSAL